MHPKKETMFGRNWPKQTFFAYMNGKISIPSPSGLNIRVLGIHCVLPLCSDSRERGQEF